MSHLPFKEAVAGSSPVEGAGDAAIRKDAEDRTGLYDIPINVSRLGLVGLGEARSGEAGHGYHPFG